VSRDERGGRLSTRLDGRESPDDPAQLLVGEAPAKGFPRLPLSSFEEGQSGSPIEIATTIVPIPSNPLQAHGCIVAAAEADVNPRQDRVRGNSVVLSLLVALLDLEDLDRRGNVRRPMLRRAL
jgi:hypothetical protein